ncbi:MAG: response regulator [Elusimicrobia bacterium]|nr:response regulator [Elusimicrobiota bacterium]
MSERVLVVEDDPLVAQVVERTLAGRGLEVQRAATGEEGLAAARRRPPDAVVLDINLPGQDGLSVLRDLRADFRTGLVPVVLVTGGDSEDVAGGLARGADDFLSKPFDPRELAARVQSAMRRSRRDRGSSPLTGLAGAPTIEAEVERRRAGGGRWALLYADIDRFKAFNDARGVAAGDAVIRSTADLLREAAARVPDAFLGHVGGDDFVLLCPCEWAVPAAEALASAFDRGRLGRLAPQVTLSIAVLAVDGAGPGGYETLAARAAEVKRRLKKRTAWCRSAVLSSCT